MTEEDIEEDESEYDVPATRRSPKKRVTVDEDDIDEENESEAEEAMLGAAIQESIRIARNETAGTSSAGAGSSSKPRLSGPAARAAAAAERRLGLAQSESVEDFTSAFGAEDDEVLEISDDDEPLATKTKAKGKSKAKGKKTKVADTSKPKVMTLAEQKRLRSEARAQARLERNSTRAEEKALKAKLGRRLTYVGFNVFFPSFFSILYTSSLNAFYLR